MSREGAQKLGRSRPTLAAGEGLPPHAPSSRAVSPAWRRRPEDRVDPRRGPRASTAYHVPTADGLVKLDAMENPYGLPAELQREIAAWSAQRRDEPLSRSGGAGAQGAAARGRWRSPRHGRAARQRLGRDDPHPRPGRARPGAVLLAPSRASSCSAWSRTSRAAVRRRAAGAGLQARLPRLLQRDARAPARRSTFIAYPNNPTGNLFDAERDRAHHRGGAGAGRGRRGLPRVRGQELHAAAGALSEPAGDAHTVQARPRRAAPRARWSGGRSGFASSTRCARPTTSTC